MEINDNIFHYFYKEDFAAMYLFPAGVFPAGPWRMIFNTNALNVNSDYVISFDGQQYTHCKPVDGIAGGMWLEFKGHRLKPGRLIFEYRREIANNIFVNGKQHRVLPTFTNIELWEQPSDENVATEITPIIERTIRGYSAYELYLQTHPESTLTQEQYAAAPIVAAEMATDLIESAAELEGRIVLAEELRGEGEATRERSEISRGNAEAGRVLVEQGRATAETVRTKTEGKRIIVETLRVDAEGRRVLAEGDRVTADAQRGTTEKQRTTAESARVKAEALRVTAEEGRQTATTSAIERTDLASEAATSAATLANESAQIVEQIAGSSAVIDVAGGHTYICGELTSLNLRTVGDSPRDSFIRFGSGAVATTLTLPSNLKVGGYVKPAPNTTYEIAIANRVAFFAWVQ